MPKVEELLRSLMQGLPPGLASGASGLREDLENKAHRGMAVLDEL